MPDDARGSCIKIRDLSPCLSDSGTRDVCKRTRFFPEAFVMCAPLLSAISIRYFVVRFCERSDYVQICRKICGLGCVTRSLAHTQFTQPSPHIFLHFCTSYAHVAHAVCK